MSNLDPTVDDLSAVQADDLLLDHLGSALPGTASHLADDELNALMLAWRNEVETDSIPPLVDVETALQVIAANVRGWWATNTSLKVAALLLLAAVIVSVAVALTATDL